ncbi:hypothetical protein PUMCH_001243 [Australozyma saopauloensis]|uniref:PPM-type phosphatase domain-containing protein n=1 Tax=Australozyma saopauloensis TaxID=291208 RepID=A0AAX4H685_9ASCO|nr:hypothetical protein PUMCH_001243 [[Candida] saopauloensis]
MLPVDEPDESHTETPPAVSQTVNIGKTPTIGQEKSSEVQDAFNGLSFLVGVAENKNLAYRAKMEDVHTYIANFAERVDWGYFAIFDGHAGKQTARWCGNNLHELLEQAILSKEEEYGPSDASPHNLYDVREILRDVFVKADELIEQDGSGTSGCTVATAILRWETAENTAQEKSYDNHDAKRNFEFLPQKNHRRMLYTSNVGDLRVVLCRSGRLYRLSYDHKASDHNEIARVREAGGLIVNHRVNGVFAITRSLGDSYIKNLVTGKPFTTATEITDQDEFLILACDGVWDVLSDEAACKYVQGVFKQQAENGQVFDPIEAAKKLCKLAIDKGSTDNITVMIVKLDPAVFGD